GTVDGDSQAAALPAFQVAPPELLLTGIAGLALSHGKNLQGTGEENRVPKVTTDTRTGWTVRLPSRQPAPASAGGIPAHLAWRHRRKGRLYFQQTISPRTPGPG